jgi:hypothetical protein
LAKKIVNKSVSFNVVDPFQEQLRKHTEQYTNFSAYIKQLIQRDMENGIKKAPTPMVNNQGNMAHVVKTPNGGIKIDCRKLG